MVEEVGKIIDDSQQREVQKRTTRIQVAVAKLLKAHNMEFLRTGIPKRECGRSPWRRRKRSRGRKMSYRDALMIML